MIRTRRLSTNQFVARPEDEQRVAPPLQGMQLVVPFEWNPSKQPTHVAFEVLALPLKP